MATNLKDLKLLSVQQVAQIMNVSEGTVRRLIHNRKIPVVIVSEETYRFHPDKIQSWIDQGGLRDVIQD